MTSWHRSGVPSARFPPSARFIASWGSASRPSYRVTARPGDGYTFGYRVLQRGLGPDVPGRPKVSRGCHRRAGEPEWSTSRQSSSELTKMAMRVFLEVGPGSSCTRLIGRILGRGRIWPVPRHRGIRSARRRS